MALPQIITRLSGRLKAILPVQTSAGAGDAEKIPALDAGGRLDISLLPSGTGPTNKVVASSENLAANDLVNLWDDAGTIKVRKADADSAGKQAHGYVLAAVTAPANATVYFEGEIPGLTGKTPGAYQWLSAVAGEMTETPPTGAGVLSQNIGVATSATTVNFQLQEPVELAA